jgi:hydrogenase nickel incorporation protein HypA/HybF
MHELSMAEAIVNTVVDAANKNDAVEVLEVTIEIGNLTMLNPEQLKFLLDILIEDTIMKNAEIVIEEIHITIECKTCDYKGTANTEGSDHYLTVVTCPECNERNLEIVTGRECNVKNIRIEKDDEDA